MRFDFNPRTREGCDAQGRVAVNAAGVISIHAPVKGATQFTDAGQRHQRHFNPRTREGCDPIRLFAKPFRPYFNPRTREGCDVVLDHLFIAGTSISIHAPVKGATYDCRGLPGRAGNFNPRTREGCDGVNGNYLPVPMIFQSTHP